MSIFMEVWHRIWPLDPESYRAFTTYYEKFVVGANPKTLDVLGGWRFTDGDSNSDLTLYRFPSMGDIEASMRSFGMEPEYLRATEALFRRIQIDEKRGIAFPMPHVSEERLSESLSPKATHPRPYVRLLRTLPPTERPAAYEALGRLMEEREKVDPSRLVAAYEYIVGDVTRCCEIWRLAEGAGAFDPLPREVEEGLRASISALAPVVELRAMSPLSYSRLR